jgi:hypothetical protein
MNVELPHVEARHGEWEDGLDRIAAAKRRNQNAWAQRRHRRGGLTRLEKTIALHSDGPLEIKADLFKQAMNEDLPGIMTKVELKTEMDSLVLRIGALVPAPHYLHTLLTRIAKDFPVFRELIPNKEAMKKRLQRRRPV